MFYDNLIKNINILSIFLYTSAKINFFKKKKTNWKITFIKTGLKTMTGGRLKRLQKYLNKDTFMLTYGDGISNVNLKKLLQFHEKKRLFLLRQNS